MLFNMQQIHHTYHIVYYEAIKAEIYFFIDLNSETVREEQQHSEKKIMQKPNHRRKFAETTAKE